MRSASSRRDFLKSVLLAAGAAQVIDPWNLSAAPPSAGRRYVNIAPQAGIHFIHNNGAFGKKYLPETMGSGCAFIDYDNDGKQDILLINGTDFPGHVRRQTTMKLYHNNGNGTFTDVTARARLNVPMYGMGVAIGDYDNDGWDDIYVTALGEAHLYHNEHNGTFRDVTKEAGVNNTGYGTSAAWFDYDRDGKLDLFVCNYVQWSQKKDIYCTLDGHHKSYCTPEAYGGESCRLFHNVGNGRFEDVTRQAGIYDPTGKNLGVAIIDYNMDGWPDIAVSDDTEPNKLYRNNHNGTFTQDSVQAGIAYDMNGIARGAMGIDAADFNRSGYPSLAIGNFSNQMLGLYQNEKHNFFIDVAPQSAIGQDSRLALTFGLFFYDYDLDGRLDLFVANGHIEPQISLIQAQVTYAERPLLFHNEGTSRFDEIGKQVGLTRQIVARGAAYADINNDGYLDVLVTTNNGPAYLYRNEGPNTNNAIRIKTVGTRSNRNGIGARVRVHTGGVVNWQTVHSGSSYCSQSELPLTFGLGKSGSAEEVHIIWPSGHEDTLKNLKANASYTIQEGGKILSNHPFKR
ncbi:MAG: CRTAC1 family protein [Acidobacteriota bacterium]